MKRKLLILSFLISLISTQLFAQIDTRALYQRKVNSYSKMKNIGLGLGIGGGVSTVLGIALMATGDWGTNSTTQSNYGYSNSSYNTGPDASVVFGILLLEAGVASGITGIVLGSIGSKKVKFYQAKLNGLSINCTPKLNGLCLTLKF